MMQPKNFGRLEKLLVELGKKPDLIVISETKLQSKFNYFIPGYSFVQSNSITSGRGLGFLIKDTIDLILQMTLF